MDIDLLSKMVMELILDNDEVTLPGVGSFVAEVVPSSFSDRGYTINPPYRRLSFRQRESSENKLIDFYARSNHLDKQMAASILMKFLTEMKEILQKKKTIVFPGLGRLRATKENTFFFIPDENLDIYPEGFGLEPVSLKTHVETEDEIQAVVESLEHTISSNDPAPVEDTCDNLLEDSEPIEIVPADEAPGSMDNGYKAEEVIDIPSDKPEMPGVPPSQSLIQEITPEPEGRSEPEETLQTAGPVVKERKPMSPALKWIISIVALTVILLCLFVLVAHIAPDFMDSILYSKEELELIRSFQL